MGIKSAYLLSWLQCIPWPDKLRQTSFLYVKLIFGYLTNKMDIIERDLSMDYAKRVVCFFAGCIIWASQGMAGNNPIGWTLDHSFPDSVQSGVSYSITYTLTNQLPMKLAHPLNILKTASPASNFAYQDNCSGQYLSPRQSCTVTVNLNALTVGVKTVQLSIAGYDKNVVPLPEIVTMATSTPVAGDVIGADTQPLPGSMTAASSADYTFTFTNRSQTDATGINVSVSQTTGTVTSLPNNQPCTAGMTLVANGGYCLVTGKYIPASSPVSQNVSATMTFNGAMGSPVTVSTSTTVQAPAGPIVGSVLQGLPGLMVPNTSYTVKFLFTNTTANTTFNITGATPRTGLVTCTATNSGVCPTITSTNSCTTAPTITGNSQCEVDATFEVTSALTPPATFTLTASLAYSGSGAVSPAEVATEGTVLTTIPATRVVQMVNNCGFPVSYSLNGGAMPAPYSSSNCPGGLGTASGNYCYFNNYVGTNGNALAIGATDLVIIPAGNAGGQQWSGTISASLGCSGSSCAQAACGNGGGTTSCAVGVGFNQPATQAEITMSVNATDSYDVEVINGFHIPISMQPYSYISSDGTTLIPAIPDNYICGTPGNSTATNGFGACNWQTVTASSLPSSSSYYYWVGKGSNTPCPANTCSISGELCGLSQPTANGAIIGPVCGKFLGYWSSDELCGQQTNLPAAVISGLQCNAPTGYSSTLYPNTFTSLMKCPVPPAPPGTPQTNPTYNTCYYNLYPQGASVTQCCGCVNWWDSTQTKGIAIGANSGGTALTCPSGQTNPLWTTNIQPRVQWMKKACPSSYVYPFDDGSSSFLCSNSGGSSQANTTSYVVTFCPGNNGLPTNALEGRG